MEEERLDDELEYNDGLGEMLREKDRVFSWNKTALVVVIIIVIVLLAFFLSFNIGKKMLSKRSDELPIAPYSEAEVDRQLEQIEKDNAMARQDGNLLLETEDRPLVSQIETELAQKPESEYLEPEKKDPLENVLEMELLSEPQIIIRDAPKPAVKSKRPRIKNLSRKLPYKVIAGSFKDLKKAKTFARQLNHKKIDTYIWPYLVKGTRYYRIQVGAFDSMSDANQMKRTVQRKGYKDAYVWLKK